MLWEDSKSRFKLETDEKRTRDWETASTLTYIRNNNLSLYNMCKLTFCKDIKNVLQIGMQSTFAKILGNGNCRWLTVNHTEYYTSRYCQVIHCISPFLTNKTAHCTLYNFHERHLISPTLKWGGALHSTAHAHAHIHLVPRFYWPLMFAWFRNLDNIEGAGNCSSDNQCWAVSGILICMN